jgi:hypothetical protein
MMTVSKSMFMTAVAIGVAAVSAQAASAQDFKAVTPPPVAFGAPPAAATDKIDKGLRQVADLLGILRTGAQAAGNVNILEYNGHGVMTDWENPGAKEVELDNYTFNVSMFDNASRITFQGPNAPQTIRVVKGTKAWDESWSKDGTLTTKPADAQVASRRAMMWLEPHAIIHAAVYAANGRCPDAKQCPDLPKPAVTQEGGKSVINVTVEGNVYKATLGPDMRPNRIETTQGGHTYVATYFGYRNGTSLGQEALDKMHNGTYWPSRVVEEIDGKKVLDVIVTAGWSNPYTIYPDPDQIAKAQ